MTHRFHQSSSQFTRVALLGLLLAALAPLGYAQTQPAAPQFYQVQVVKLQPGMGAEWRKLYQTEVLPALKKAGVTRLTVLSVAQGDMRTRIIIRPLDSLTELDEPIRLAKALGPEAAQALNQKLSRFYTEWHVYVTQARPDLGLPPTSNEPAKLMLSIKLTVMPGRAAEYEKFAKENLLPVNQKAGGKGVLTGKVVMGGDPNEYRTLLLFDSYADGVKFEMARAKAAAELKLSPVMPAGVLANIEITVVRPVPELSIQPAAQKAAQ